MSYPSPRVPFSASPRDTYPSELPHRLLPDLPTPLSPPFSSLQSCPPPRALFLPFTRAVYPSELPSGLSPGLTAPSSSVPDILQSRRPPETYLWLPPELPAIPSSFIDPLQRYPPSRALLPELIFPLNSLPGFLQSRLPPRALFSTSLRAAHPPGLPPRFPLKRPPGSLPGSPQGCLPPRAFLSALFKTAYPLKLSPRLPPELTAPPGTLPSLPPSFLPSYSPSTQKHLDGSPPIRSLSYFPIRAPGYPHLIATLSVSPPSHQPSTLTTPYPHSPPRQAAIRHSPTHSTPLDT
jgi:hypothetical protein